MSNGSDARSSLEHLSALADGELEAGVVSAACLTWRDDSDSRATWHAYHLIGDVLRSDDLASSPSRDAAFLAALRMRLAAEPVVLAPSLAPAAGRSPVEAKRRVGAERSSRWSWMAPSAVAAGFVVVAGAMMATNPGTPVRDLATVSSGGAPQVAMIPADAPASAFTVSDVVTQPVIFTAPNRQLIRDARLDRYLSAHKEFAGSTALGVPSGFLRDAVAESPGR